MKTNWLQEKNEYTARWRIGFGVHAGEPTGIHLQFYRLSKICTSDFSILKKLSLNVYLSKEGYIFSNTLKNSNKGWEAGGTRLGLDIKFYFPILLNPYFSFGCESGTRYFNSKSEINTDLFGSIGVEQKLFGLKLSTRSSLNTGIFLDAKYNRCINNNFSYFLPCFGFRVHFL